MVRILLGGDPLPRGELAQILREAGLEPELLGRSHGRIPAAQLAMIWKAMESSADDECLGLHLGELRGGVPTGHVLFAAMLNSPTLGAALERYCRYHDIMADFVRPRLSAEGDDTMIGLETRPGVTLHRQHVEFIFSALVSIVSRLAASPFRGQARFSHRRPADVSEHRRIFGSVPRFGQPADELLFAGAYLEQPIAAADGQLLQVLEAYSERLLRRVRPTEAWSGRVADLLARTLCDGKPSLARVAKGLAVSQRSLQAKLKAEGTSYQAVLDDVRRNLALDHLEDDRLSLAEIAFLLGYADQSAFNHAFRKWTGETPLAARERSRPR